MAGRGRGTSQNVTNDLLTQMVAALQQVNENLQNLNRNVMPSPSSQPLVPSRLVEYRELDECCRRNPNQFHGGFAPDAGRLGRVYPNLCAGGGIDVYVLVSGCGKWWNIYYRVSLLDVVSIELSANCMSSIKVEYLYNVYVIDLDVCKLAMINDPMVGGGVGETCKVAKDQTQLSPSDTVGSSYVATLWLELCSDIVGSSYVATLWLELCSDIVRSSYVATLWIELCSDTVGSNYVATLWLELCSDTVGSSYVATLWLELCSDTEGSSYVATLWLELYSDIVGSSYVATLWLELCSDNVGSSYVATLWLELRSDTLGSSYVATLWLKLCSMVGRRFKDVWIMSLEAFIFKVLIFIGL
ncbi:hypothetical protein Lal_00022905 [Lupinus albus]|nr:hypothetical protein Lal_00022905 [Lupinus albus]